MIGVLAEERCHPRKERAGEKCLFAMVSDTSFSGARIQRLILLLYIGDDNITNVIHQARECNRLPPVCGGRECVICRNKRRQLLPDKKGIPCLYSYL